jgi:integrase
MAADSNGVPTRGKSNTLRPPKPPVRNFPLYAHALGYWSKKIGGRLHYFGRWGKIVKGQMTLVAEDGAWQAALALYQAQREDLEAGRTPRTKSNGLTIKELCDRFYTAKKRKCDSGEITPGSLAEYDAACKLIVTAFGRERRVDDLVADDFEALRATMAKQWGPVRLGNTIGRVRTVFKYGFDAGLIDNPVRYGPEFKKPSKHVMRQHRAAGGQKLFTADEVRGMIGAAGPQLKAMILLGINAAFGNHDCGSLPLSALDLDHGWVRFPRPKTGIDRRCPLWPETVEALRAVVVTDKTPKDANAFAMRCERRDNAVTRAFGRLLKNLKINGRRGLGFYSLRHTFRTVADNTKDVPAVRLIMGHADGSIDDVYREGIDDARLRVVTDYVRCWLFRKPAEAPTDEPAKPKRQRKPKGKPAPSGDESAPALRLFAG